MNRFEEALNYYDKAIKINPNFSDLYYYKANALVYNISQYFLVQLRRVNEALEQYDIAIQKNPENQNYHKQKENATLNTYNENQNQNNCHILNQFFTNSNYYSFDPNNNGR